MAIRINPSLSGKIGVAPAASEKLAIRPYIGLTGTPAAKSVWDNNFVFVSHMNDNPDTSHIKDSTSNNNDGAKKGANEPNEVDGDIGKAQNFDGSNDYIAIPNDALISGANPRTVETYMFTKENSAYQMYISWGEALPSKGWIGEIGRETDGKLTVNVQSQTYSEPGASINTSSYQYVVLAFNGTKILCYVDGVNVIDVTPDPVLNTTVGTGRIGLRGYSTNYPYEGIIDEVRISNIDRSDAWIAATNKSLRDNLITYGAISNESTTLTIASSDIDSNLTNFPIYLNLGASSGKTSTDLSALFTQVGANWQRLELRYKGQNCYMEVVSWDTGTPYAEIHAKIPFISSSENTTLTLSWG